MKEEEAGTSIGREEYYLECSRVDLKIAGGRGEKEKRRMRKEWAWKGRR